MAKCKFTAAQLAVIRKNIVKDIYALSNYKFTNGLGSKITDAEIGQICIKYGVSANVGIKAWNNKNLYMDPNHSCFKDGSHLATPKQKQYMINYYKTGYVHTMKNIKDIRQLASILKEFLYSPLTNKEFSGKYQIPIIKIYNEIRRLYASGKIAHKGWTTEEQIMDYNFDGRDHGKHIDLCDAISFCKYEARSALGLQCNKNYDNTPEELKLEYRRLTFILKSFLDDRIINKPNLKLVSVRKK